VEGGHDFAITEDRFLVDPWLYHYYAQPPVQDLTYPAGKAEAAARYSPVVKVSRARIAMRETRYAEWNL
jgi:hypothetical protein